MQFGYTILYVPDVTEAVTFYADAFGLSLSFMTDGKDYAQMATGATCLAFALETLAESNGVLFEKNSLARSRAPGFEIGLIAEDVEDAYKQACARGAVSVVAPSQKPWGQWVAYVRDLNGVLVEICSPLA